MVENELIGLGLKDDRIDSIGRCGDVYIVINVKKDLSRENAVFIAEYIFDNDVISNSGLVYLNFYKNGDFMFQLFQMGKKWVESGSEFY
ncbi:hypothetical protein J3R74_002669 [Puniceicoccus vermicola]|uniref:Uncharacterized protein n=1 Tax=Puniceicoccus vermicola TaxID=388746 RepID=A0A7X1AZM6_9BACT|nr:hypothetical protein [Puniceicoccus vermicola]MBC2602918.1 hypothetical protein [Puniceicoccus vermicola]